MTRVSLTGTSDAPNAQRVRSHCPDLLEKLNVFYEGIWVSKRVEPAIKELIRMRCATVNTCSYWLNFRYAAGRYDGMTEEKLMNVHDATSDVFTERERAVLNFVTTMSTNDTASADDAFAGMRPFFDEPQLVEIGLAVATLHGMNLFNNMFGIEPEGHPMESFTGVDKSMAAE